jgi:hypothetical protein
MRRIIYILLVLVLTMTTIGCVDNNQQMQQSQKQQANQISGIAPGAKIDNNVDIPNRNIVESKIGTPISKTLEGGKVTMLLPDGWTTKMFPGCTGLVAVDMSNTARSVIFLNGLYQSVDPLPPGITPEDYVTTYMQNDFKTMSDVKLIKYEDVDLSNLRAGGANVKAMRISFKNNGIPATGSFTVNTYGTSMSSAVGYIWGISSTENEFEADGGILLKMIMSIKYDGTTLQGCKDVLKGSWGIKE